MSDDDQHDWGDDDRYDLLFGLLGAGLVGILALVLWILVIGLWVLVIGFVEALVGWLR